ncbi:UNVERIFIED_CONTAM: hypothetical protein FKN15_071879 [Acipenser sinensis]
MMEYPMLKAAILTRVGATPEGFRKKFREEVFADTEHPQAVAHCLKDYAMGWLNSDVNTKARLVEVTVRVLSGMLGSRTLSAGVTPGTRNSGPGGPVGTVPGSRTNTRQAA